MPKPRLVYDPYKKSAPWVDKSDDVLKIKIEDIANMTKEQHLEIVDKLDYLETDEYRFQKSLSCEEFKEYAARFKSYVDKVPWWKRLWWTYFSFI